jgi:hypothetical protein
MEPMFKPTASAREVLAQIDEWAYTASTQEAKKLWDVLTALRGPDNGDRVLKARTTAVIRQHSVPALADLSHAFVLGASSVECPPLPDHFHHHIRRAARALGVKVVEPQEDSPATGG